jgi:hypothetical protein
LLYHKYTAGSQKGKRRVWRGAAAGIRYPEEEMKMVKRGICAKITLMPYTGTINFYLNIVQTVLLLVIAGALGFLVYRSGRRPTGIRKSLHSRRQEVYDDVVRVLTMLGKRGEIRKEELLDFRSRTRDAALLFDAETADYIDEIYNRGVKLISTNELLQGTGLPIGDERDRITIENAKQTIWLADQLAMVKKKFERYLDLT